MVQSSSAQDLEGRDGAVIYRNLPEGAKVRLRNGAIAEVTGNPHDGGWLLVRFIAHPAEPSKVGEEEMVYFVDVENLA